MEDEKDDESTRKGKKGKWRKSCKHLLSTQSVCWSRFMYVVEMIKNRKYLKEAKHRE